MYRAPAVASIHNPALHIHLGKEAPMTQQTITLGFLVHGIIFSKIPI
jgi:hypothetical protein